MTLLLSLMPPIAWILLFFALLLSVSHLYVQNRNWGKVVISSLFVLVLVLVAGWSWGYKISKSPLPPPITSN